MLLHFDMVGFEEFNVGQKNISRLKRVSEQELQKEHVLSIDFTESVLRKLIMARAGPGRSRPRKKMLSPWQWVHHKESLKPDREGVKIAGKRFQIAQKLVNLMPYSAHRPF